MIGNQPTESGDRLAWEIKAVAERLRRLSPARLRMPMPPYPSRAQAGRMLAQRLADAASGVATRGADQPPKWLEVPEIDVFAVGEQVAVTGADLVRELAGGVDHAVGAGSGAADTGSGAAVPADAMIWTRSGRRPVSAVTEELLATLRELRLGL